MSPWRSPYLRWRIETYSGLHAESIGFLDFWRFLWRERSHLVRFLRWVDEMKKPLPNGRGFHEKAAPVQHILPSTKED